MVRKLKAKYEWCFSRYKSNNIGAADAIISSAAKDRRDNVFRSKQTINSVLPKIFRGFEARKKVRLMFWRPKDSMKGKCYLFRDYKQRNKARLVYLECKQQQDIYGWCIFNIKYRKILERTYLQKRKQQTRDRWCF